MNKISQNRESYYENFTEKFELHSPVTNLSGSITKARRAVLKLEWSTLRLIYVGNTNLTQNT